MRSVDVSDATLVARAQQGDGSAYAILYQRYEPVVSRIVTARLGDQGDPADVVQEVFTVAWCRLGSLRDPERLRPWMSQIARRTSIDHGRRHRRRPTEHGGETLAWVPDPGPGPDDLVAAADLARRLGVGVRGLARRDATALALTVDLGFGPTEVAAALGVSEGNAKVILHRARRRLRQAIAGG